VISRRRAGEGGGVAAGLAGTLLAHGIVVLFLVAATRPPEAGPQVYAVELVAAPAPLPDMKPAPEAVQRPPAPAPAPTKPAPRKPAPKTAPVPTPKPVAEPRPAEPTPRASQPVQPLPGEKPSTGSDVATVSTPGLQFPFPDYLRNIVQEIYRRWQRPLGNAALRSEVSFLILRDGSVHEIRVSRPSGSFSFDLAAQGAVEAAGTSRAFGPLPDGWGADVLPVTFYFTPRSQ
jgi:periplasmic protein TonB